MFKSALSFQFLFRIFQPISNPIQVLAFLWPSSSQSVFEPNTVDQTEIETAIRISTASQRWLSKDKAQNAIKVDFERPGVA